MSFATRTLIRVLEYVEIKSLSPNEEISFESSFNYEQIDHIKTYVINKEDLPPSADLDFGFDNPEDAKVSFLIILAAFMLII